MRSPEVIWGAGDGCAVRRGGKDLECARWRENIERRDAVLAQVDTDRADTREGGPGRGVKSWRQCILLGEEA